MKTLSKFDRLGVRQHQIYVQRPNSVLQSNLESKVTTAMGFNASGRNSGMSQNISSERIKEVRSIQRTDQEVSKETSQEDSEKLLKVKRELALMIKVSESSKSPKQQSGIKGQINKQNSQKPQSQTKELLVDTSQKPNHYAKLELYPLILKLKRRKLTNRSSNKLNSQLTTYQK